MSNRTADKTSSSGNGKKRLSRADRAEQLLQIAEGLFLDRGYDGTTLEDVVRVAGVTRPVVYDHFGSKEKLFLAVAQRARSQYEAMLATAIEEATERDVDSLFKIGASVFFQFLENDPKRWFMLFAATNISGEELTQQLINLRHTTIAKTARIVTEAFDGVSEEDAVPYAYAISGAGELLGLWWSANPDIPRTKVEDIYCKFMLKGAAAMYPEPA